MWLQIVQHGEVGRSAIVRRKDAYEAKEEDIQNSGKASIGIWRRDMVNNEKPRKEIEGE